MNPRQRERPFDLIRKLRLDELTLKWADAASSARDDRGYELHIGGTKFGFVRYNIGNSQGHAGMFTVYAWEPYDDPWELFEDRHASQPAPVTFVHHGDKETIERVVAVLQSAASNVGP